MSLKSRVRKATKVAFKKSKTIQVEVIYKELGEEQYDVNLKEASRQVLASHAVIGFITSFTSKEVLSGLVSPEDLRLTLERRVVTWDCDVHDTINIDGDDWKIKSLKEENSGSVVIFTLMRE